MTQPKIVGVLTCFNRKPMTLSCLRAVEASAHHAGVSLDLILVDDASTDGTAVAVRSAFPWVEVVEGSGTLFWNRGMHKGFELAMKRGADHFLWINDDTELLIDALERLLQQSSDLARAEGKPVVVVGATAERGADRISYGGRVAPSRLKPFNYQLVWSATEPLPCEAMEGNCVLIPREVAMQVGNLDPVFEHAMGDTDYGLRARRKGFKLFVSAGIVGHCSSNPASGTYFDSSLPIRARWRLMLGRKGLPVRSWLHFSKRHGGSLWPLYFSWPYAKLALSSVASLASRRTTR